MVTKFFKWLIQPFENNDTKIIEQTSNEVLVDKIVGAIDSLKQEKIPAISSEIQSKSLYRPITFDNYIGQNKAKTLLKSFIEGTKKRGKVFPHLLIYGPAGCGKTTLAKIIANEMKVEFRQIISSTIDDSNIIINLAEEVDGGVIFLDEIHGLERDACEPLYSLMEDFIAYDNYDIKPFTLIGATTEVGELIKDRRPFYDRFKINIELEDYSKPDIKEIIKKYKIETFPTETINNKTYERIATNARLTPRKAISLLETTLYLNDNVKLALSSYDIIAEGYTNKDLKVLEYIKFSNGIVGLETLASYLNTSKENYLYDIEPWLLKNNLIIRSSRGRKITEDGNKVITKLKRKIKENKNDNSN